MGGGDLNSKKSWHPNTMKNQERVWKAEKAAAEEKKRIMELQRERAEERVRSELNDMVKQNLGSTTDNRLNWMYDKPDKKVQEEDYLLGKTIDNNYGKSEKDDEDVFPAVSRRVVGSSMLTNAGDAQVDLARKVREDPLLLVKERERAARAALLNNPFHRRRIAELLRREKEEKDVKKKSKSNGKDLDNTLAAKLSALGGDKGIDIAKLLASDDDDSSSDTDSDEAKQKKKKKRKKSNKKKKKSKKRHDLSTSEDSSDNEKKNRVKPERSPHTNHEYRKRKSDAFDIERNERKATRKEGRHGLNKDLNAAEDARSRRRGIEASPGPRLNHRRHGRDDVDEKSRNSRRDRSRRRDTSDEAREGGGRALPEHGMSGSDGRRKGMSEEERAARLAAMAAAGAEREEMRGRRVADQRSEAAHEDAAPRAPGLRSEARALPNSLESRIHSNRHYIQRGRHHMNENFARRQ